METRKWDKINIETSLLGFGCMRFKTINGKIDENKALELIDKAYKSKINYFDTAIPYTDGQNEAFVGKALKKYPRESFFLATKFSMACYKTKEEAMQTIDKQLKELQTDYIDFYLVHALSKERFAKFKEWNMYEELLKWKKEGKIKHIGFSFHDSYEVFMDILNTYDWEFVQIQLNYMDINIQQGIKGYYELEKRNIPVIVMEPVKGGKLASFNKEISKEFTNRSDASIASWALRWVGSLKGVKVILSGMNEMEQLDDNLNTFINFKPLSEDEQKVISQVREKLLKINKVGCTNCKYCMPCPRNVDIPGVFRIYNNYAMYDNKSSAKWEYSEFIKDKEDMSQCIKCGTCIKKCPQGINPIEVFEKIKEEMEFILQ